MQDKHSKRNVHEGDVVSVMNESKLLRGRWRVGHIVLR